MSIPRSSKAAAHFRFISDPALPNGHQHFLDSPIRPEKPSAWRNLFDRECGRVREGLSQLILKRNAEKDLQETPGISDHMVDGYSTLEQKYGKYWKTIGRGAHGTISIFRKTTPDGREVRLVAVKESHQRPGQDSVEDDKQMLIEYGSHLTSDLQHANVVRVFDVFQSEHGKLYEAMEYCAAGDLFSLIQSEWPFEVEEAHCFFKQLMRGVRYLHELGIAHLDLKPENLLLTETGNLKISDFSCSQWLRRPGDGDGGLRLVSGRRGSAPYVAPEEYTDDEFDGQAADVWACGVIYMVLRLGHYFWPSARKEDRYYTSYVEGRRVEAGFEPVESLDPVSSRPWVATWPALSPSRKSDNHPGRVS
ncbi:HAL protein kinase [Diaporthe sp. PMI_573]|nr:HAL protein kinase [Diaporthaceae sp. PMI_573]